MGGIFSKKVADWKQKPSSSFKNSFFSTAMNGSNKLDRNSRNAQSHKTLEDLSVKSIQKIIVKSIYNYHSPKG